MFLWEIGVNVTVLIFLFIFSVGEFMSFTSKILVERTATASRASVKEQGKWNMLTS